MLMTGKNKEEKENIFFFDIVFYFKKKLFLTIIKILENFVEFFN